MKNKNLVLIGNSHISQFLVNPSYNIFIEKLEFPGASIKGLLKENSTIGLKNMINSHDFTNKLAIFILGQCDVEFGYYYKSVIQNKKINIDDFISDLIDKYVNYLSNLKFDFVVLGINPCVSDDIRHNFVVNFQDTQCHKTNKFNETGTLDDKYIYENYLHIYNDTLEMRNKIHKKFNEILKIKCESNGFNFVDLWDDITINDKIKNEFKPDRVDHHLKPSEKLFDYLFNKINKFII